MNKSMLLIQLEQDGLNAMRDKEYKKAISLFKQITQIAPDYEHGLAFYNLALAFEELNELQKAENAYKTAIFYDSQDPIKVGGYASFLYLHGDAYQAFDAYLSLIALYNKENDEESKKSCYPALYMLGEKMGWNKQKTEAIIANPDLFYK